MDNTFDFILKNVSVSSPEDKIDVKVEQIEIHCSMKCDEKVAMKIYDLANVLVSFLTK